MKITINALVEGGKANAGPPLGPALGPMGVNIGQVIAAINEKTKVFAGISVPVKVLVDKESKEFEIVIGSPPTSALIKKELGFEKGAKERGEKVANLSLQQLKKLVDMKFGVSQGKTLKDVAKEILGTCVSMGVTCEGKDPRIITDEIYQGKHDSLFGE